jgi:hypothetical protein
MTWKESKISVASTEGKPECRSLSSRRRIESGIAATHGKVVGDPKVAKKS